jgi:nitrite reductase/ring-hydroxylating ferredoxin subunit
MWKRILNVFRGRSLVIEGVDRLSEGRAKKFATGDSLAGDPEFLLCRIDGSLYAIDTRCPHEGGRFLEGELIGGREVHCPLHRYQFDPKTGRPTNALCARARTYRLKEKGISCEVWY